MADANFRPSKVAGGDSGAQAAKVYLNCVEETIESSLSDVIHEVARGLSIASSPPDVEKQSWIRECMEQEIKHAIWVMVNNTQLLSKENQSDQVSASDVKAAMKKAIRSALQGYLSASENAEVPEDRTKDQKEFSEELQGALRGMVSDDGDIDAVYREAIEDYGTVDQGLNMATVGVDEATNWGEEAVPKKKVLPDGVSLDFSKLDKI